MSPMRSILKWHGGKTYLAPRIVAMMPPHVHYVEPYFGGGAVLFAKDPEGVSEVVNDVDGDLTNFWRVLRSDTLFEQLRHRLEATPFSEERFDDSSYWTADDRLVVRACRFFVRVRQSLAGRQKAFAPLSRTRTRRGMNEQAAAWLTAVDRLPEVHARLRRVVILNRDALDVIREQDGPDTLCYLDPPYLSETRTSPDVYRHEMTEDDHQELLTTLVCDRLEGRVILSGYRSEMYDKVLHRWTRVDFPVPNHAAGGDCKRTMTECVWCNFQPERVPAASG